MPRFSAHVGYLFPELPLLERFDAVAKAGFKAVDMPVCYEVPAAALRDAVKRNGLTPLGINTPKHDIGGSHSLGAVPGREKDWEILFDQAMDYATTIGNSAIHCPTNSSTTTAPCEARREAMVDFPEAIPPVSPISCTRPPYPPIHPRFRLRRGAGGWALTAERPVPRGRPFRETDLSCWS